MPSKKERRGRAAVSGLVTRAVKALAHLLIGAVVSVACLMLVSVLLVTAVVALTVVGAGLLPEGVGTLRRLAGYQRKRTAGWMGRPVREAYLPIEGSVKERLQQAATDPATARDLVWMIADIIYGFALLLAALAIFVPVLLVDVVWVGVARQGAALSPLIGRLADLEAAWSYQLLRPAPGAASGDRIRQLTATRAAAIDAHRFELRRIERDLHDGAQAHLVATSMRIGLARRAYDSDPEVSRRLLDDAQDQAELALRELRQVVRGIQPPILADRGLAGAVRALAAGAGLTVALDVDGIDDRLRAPAAVESAAYFVVAEALTNVAKHSGADAAEVLMTRAVDGLQIRVQDEGCGGGAEDHCGSGLLGIRRRVEALDGRMRMTSPPGGPTVICVTLPCEWSPSVAGDFEAEGDSRAHRAR